nr:DUF308 domain-containing protein [uncultured Blautia sp.]
MSFFTSKLVQRKLDKHHLCVCFLDIIPAFVHCETIGFHLIYPHTKTTEVINLKQIKIACTGYILISIVFYITGLLCIVDPRLIQAHSGTLAGIILIAYGIIKIIGYFSKDLYCLAFQYDFACGIFLIVLGIVALCMSARFKDSSLLAALGILVLLDSLLSIQTALDSRKFGLSSWKYILILSLITGTFGVLTISENTITFAGCALLAEGAMRHYIVQNTARLPDYHFLNDNEPSK